MVGKAESKKEIGVLYKGTIGGVDVFVCSACLASGGPYHVFSTKEVIRSGDDRHLRCARCGTWSC